MSKLVINESKEKHCQTAVIIITHSRSTLLTRTLESLKESSLACISEILVIENGSTERYSEKTCKQWKGPIPIKYYSLEDSRKTIALNFALEKTNSEFICFLDDDIRIEKQTLDTFSTAAIRYGHGFFFGGPHETEGSSTPPPDWLKCFLPASAIGLEKGKKEIIDNESYFLGFNWAAFKKDILMCGGFPEYLGPNALYKCAGDETVMQKRLVNKGMKSVYLPKAKTYHFVPPERCNYNFALNRSYLSGTTQTIYAQIEGKENPRLFPPKWQINRFIQLFIKVFINKLLMLEKSKLISLEHRLYFHKGSLFGYWIIFRHKLRKYQSTKN